MAGEEYETFTVDEVSRILRVNRDTVRRMLRQRRLRGVRMGKSWRILRTDLDAYLRAERSGEDTRMAEPAAGLAS